MGPRKRLTFEQKEKLINESKTAGFDRKKACENYGIAISTLSTILNKQKDSILSSPMSGKAKSLKPAQTMC